MAKKTGSGDPDTLIGILEARSALTPDFPLYSLAPLGETETQVLRLGALWERSRAVSAWLQRLGQPGDRVFLLLGSGTEFPAAFFGCLAARRIPVPVPPPRVGRGAGGLGQLGEVAASAQPVAVLTSTDTFERMAPLMDGSPALAAARWAPVDAIPLALADEWHRVDIDRDELAFIQYSSGSTRTPKGVMLTHANLLANARYFDRACLHDKDSRLLNWLPPFHDHGLIYGLILPLYAGIRCWIMKSAALMQAPARWMIAADRFRITHTMGPNSMFGLCAANIRDEELKGLDLSCIRHISNGAEPVRVETMRRFIARFAPAGLSPRSLAPGWGLAEATCILTGSHCRASGSGIEQRPAPRQLYLDEAALGERLLVRLPAGHPAATAMASSGFPLDGVEIRIVDPDTCEPCAPDRVGEIWVRSESVGQGYWGNPDETTACFQARLATDPTGTRYLRTGDLGFIDAEELYVTARIKDLIIVRGQNHYPQDIEWSVEECHPLVRRAGTAAFAVSAGGAEHLVVVAETTRAYRTQRDAEEVLSAIRAVIAERHGLQAAGIVLIRPGSASKTTSGKIQRAATRRAFMDGSLRSETRWVLPVLEHHRDGAGAALQENVAPPTPARPLPAPGTATPGVAAAEREQRIKTWLVQRIGEYTGLPSDRIGMRTTFGELGLDSYATTRLSGELEDELALHPLPATLLYEHPTIAALAQHLAERTRNSALVRRAGPETQVAVVGYACRFPGAADAARLTAMIRHGDCVIGPPPTARRALLAPWDDALDTLGEGGYLDDIEGFDPAFFHLSPRQAEQMDPRQRLLLMVVWHALEHAGLPRERLAGSRTGVFIGLGAEDYACLAKHCANALDGHAGTGLANSIAAGRIAYFLDLHGPCLVVDTACSSSLMAVHLAAESIHRDECDTAIAAGANLVLDPGLTRLLRRAGMLSPSGRCHSFDARADGYVRSEGVGAVILQREDLALGRAAPILARVAASATIQDGRSFGLTAPNGQAQQTLLRTALARAGLDADALDYVECHGTGTPLGDPIELGALDAVLASRNLDPCPVGSIKANLGHLEAAAGIAGMIKGVICIEQDMIPPLAGFSTPNPRLAAFTRLTLPTGQARTGARPSCVGVTSMGFGGSNVHVILTRHTTPVSAPPPAGPMPLLLSAQSEPALRAVAGMLASAIQDNRADWRDLCAASLSGRSRLEEVAGFMVRDAVGLRAALERFAHGGETQPRIHRRQSISDSIAFVFSGQGSQLPAMGEAMYRRFHVFRDTIDEAAAVLDASGSPTLIECLWGAAALDGDALRDWTLLQPALVALQVAQARLLEWAGLTPRLVIGHSLGEYAAACFAGVMGFADTLMLTRTRAALTARSPPGGMASVFAAEDRVRHLLDSVGLMLDIAALNGESETVVSGAAEALERLAGLCATQGLRQVRLPIARAMHSSLLNAQCEALREAASAIRYATPRLPVIGNLLGQAVSHWDANYWAAHLRGCVRFAEGVRSAVGLGVTALVELGPRPVLQGALAQAAQSGRAIAVPIGGRDEGVCLEGLLRLDAAGATPDWHRLGFGPQAAAFLPHYPFDLGPHWLPVLPHTRTATMTPDTAPTDPVQVSSIAARLATELATLLRLEENALDHERSFLELGADSLVLVQLTRIIEDVYAVTVEIGQLFTDLPNLAVLSQGVARAVAAAAPSAPAGPACAPRESTASARHHVRPQESRPDLSAAEPAERPGIGPGSAPGLETLFTHQLDVFRSLVEGQLGALQEHSRRAPVPGTAPAPLRSLPTPAPAPVSALFAAPPRLDPRQAAHIAELVGDFTRKTVGSRRYAEQHRGHFADYRSSIGFRAALKDLTYPLVARSAQGATIRDIDGNDYIDLSMSFGACLLGHNPPAVIAALQAQLANGIQVGPESPLAGEAARLVCELTGCQRAAFANSGTEAVMTALRLARALTGRSRFARFSGSYHGHSDHTLVRAAADSGEAVPGALGVPPGIAREALILDYGTSQSLEVLRAQADGLAAILVEPIQSRNPALQPREFLQSLREIASHGGCALIFDEVITGFRIAPGGAQEYFGVRADICTYGKVAGGGMPIGIIAGDARYLDAIDGGAWGFGDDSGPGPVHTFFAGTFSAHPLAMAASVEVLKTLRARGSALLEGIASRATALATRLNRAFEDEKFPIRLHQATSLLRFVFFDNLSVEFQPLESGIFRAQMLLRGIYIWKGHTCFLCDAHDTEALDRIATAAVESARAMREGGFFPLSDSETAGAARPGTDRAAPVPAPARASAAAQIAALDRYACALIARALEKRPQGPAAASAEAQAMLEQLRHHVRATPATRSIPESRREAVDLGLDPGLLTLMARCSEHLEERLLGQASGADILFSDTGLETLARLYRQGPGMAEAHAALLARLPDTQPLSVLEIGAGTGGTTQALLSTLSGRLERYLFTDASPAFFADAERHFADETALTCATLDIARPPREQGLANQAFDLVVAANTLHATADIAESLRHARSLLKPGGTLALIELEHQHAWLDLIFGQTDGWWAARDDRSGGPLLPAARWLQHLGENGLAIASLQRIAGTLAVLTATRIADEPLQARPSPGQQGILTHIAMQPQVHTAYNEPVVLEWQGELDASRIELALGALVQRHESLRAALALDRDPTRDQTEDDWVIVPRAALPLERIDLSAFDAALAAAKAQEWLLTAEQVPFDLTSAPLMRASVVSITPDRHWLVLIAHHAIIDGISYGVLFGELMDLYAALAGTGRFAPPRPVSLAQANARQAGYRQSDRGYWQERSATLVPYLDLPTDRPFPPQRSFAAHRVGCRTTDDLASRLTAFCRSHGVTPFHVCLSVFRLLLHRICGQGASVIGVPVAIQVLHGGETYVGYGVNVLALSGTTPGGESLASLTRRTRDDFLVALRHKGLPLDELIAALGQPRDPNRPALVSVLFNYESIVTLTGPGFRVTPVVPAMALGKYELAMDVIADADGLQVCLTAAADLFDRTTAETLLGRWMNLLDHLLEHPERPVGAQDALLPNERLIQGRAVALSEDCLHWRFEREARRHPQAPAIRWGRETWSYGDLNARANRLARLLRAQGAGPNDRIGLCLPRTPELVAAMLAVLKCGAAYVPLDPAYPPARLEVLVAAADAALILCADPALGERWPERRTLMPGDPEGDADNLDLPVDPGQCAYLIFTSGSTGTPKGVAIDHRAATTFLDWTGEELPVAARVGVLACSSVCFDLSIFEIFLPLSSGGKVILVENALALAELDETDDIQLVNTVPSAMTELVRQGALPVNLEVVNLAGEALDAGLVQAVQAQRPTVSVYNLYGPSEATTYSTLLRMPPGFVGTVTIGTPAPGTRLYLLDDELLPVPPGTKGMIHLAGNGLAQGYFGRPAATAEAFLPDPYAHGERMYRTGDLGRQLPSGEIAYLGRQDSQLKLRGHRIELGEIQSHLRAVPGVDQAAVIALGSGAEARILGFFTATDAGDETLGRRISEALVAALPSHMRPARLVALRAMPLTPNGKTDTAKLRQLAEGDTPEPQAAPPATHYEQRIAAIWGRHLGIAEVSASADFFASGGHSLLAMRILHDINRELDCHLRPSDLLHSPTVRALAVVLEQQLEPRSALPGTANIGSGHRP